ncbi:hypothetical protein N1851_028205 [Merluccius polli]|uniref:Uncharacterized protein n=1 Tax=Merluccius polli TaxID=89951 RepID=A0AA47NSM9_MERPO|nr:hypothetical protein N1851_028205 [Merluccius polli]
MKGSSFGTQPVGCTDEEVKLFSLLANVERWRGSKVPDKVGTLRLKQAVTLEPMEEHLVWARLKGVQNISAGSAVVIEPTQARSRPRNILVGRTVAILRNDGWLPVKIVNPLPRPLVLRRNTKVADAFPCMALEDFDSGGLVASASQAHALQQQLLKITLLSRQPFVKPSALHRLTRIPYKELLDEAAGVRAQIVQDAFRWSNHPCEGDLESHFQMSETKKADLAGIRTSKPRALVATIPSVFGAS